MAGCTRERRKNRHCFLKCKPLAKTFIFTIFNLKEEDDMGRTSKRYLVILLAMVVGIAWIVPTAQAKTFKLAHCVKPDPKGPYQATSLKLKELVEKGA